MRLSLTDMTTIWVSAGQTFANDLELQVRACLHKPLRLTGGCEIVPICRHNSDAVQALPAPIFDVLRYALPASVFDVLREMLAQHAEAGERARQTPSPMQLNFDLPGRFFLPIRFWHDISEAMLQQLLQHAPEALPAALLTRCLEHDLGL
ncbi:hypothetical protein [Pseudomonas sp. BF-R-01]|uniref:hypothetical protein n=1 Tax=Pseudomonas sp. BF-R-01 TaxID=2832365 RepID=UPI001CC0B21F|nr:hypothetical protein [Pseudomonas sp. BF-R-01]